MAESQALLLRVTSIVISPSETKAQLVQRHWKSCKNDQEVVAWTEGTSLSKKHRTKLVTWTAHTVTWHESLAAPEHKLLAESSIPVCDVADWLNGEPPPPVADRSGLSPSPAGRQMPDRLWAGPPFYLTIRAARRPKPGGQTSMETFPQWLGAVGWLPSTL